MAIFHTNPSAYALQPYKCPGDLAKALDSTDLSPLVKLLGPFSQPGRPAVAPTAMVRAYVFSRYPGSEASSNLARFHRRFTDEQDPIRRLCGFTDVIPDRSTFSRVFRRLDDKNDLGNEVFCCISQLLRDLPWVLPREESRITRFSEGGGSNDYRQLRRRVGLSLDDFLAEFHDDAAAEDWFVQRRWPGGVQCPGCGSASVSKRLTRKPQPFRCRECRFDFSVKTGTVMHSSNLPLRKWAKALYFALGDPKGISAMRLSVMLKVQHGTALHLLHRVRKALEEGQPVFSDTVQCDETYVGGLEKNKHADKKLHSGRGATGKTPVVGVWDESSGRVWAEVIGSTDGMTLREFLNRLTLPGAKVITDQHAGYNELTGRNHVSVNHSKGQYVDDDDNTTNGIESLWAQLKRILKGVYHQVSVKHLHRYLAELLWRHNHRGTLVLEQMGSVVQRMDGRRLRLRDMRRGGRSASAKDMGLERPLAVPVQPELFLLAA